MEKPPNSSRPLNEQTLHKIYTYLILPQFGINNCDITWQPAEILGPDESLHHFYTLNRSFALIFEDYQGLGSNERFIADKVLKSDQPCKLVVPISTTTISPFYDGLRLPAPSQYCKNVTGSFTLIKLLND